MKANIRRKLVSFLKSVDQITPGPNPVHIQIGAKPYELTFYAFVVLWYDKSIDVIKDDKLRPMENVIDILRKEHQTQVLSAVKGGTHVPPEVLCEYRFKTEFYKPIKKYCRTNKIDLDA